MAFYAVEPWGGARDYLHTAMLMATLANVHRDPKKRRQPFTPADFIVDFWQQSATAQPESLASKFRQLTSHADDRDPSGQTPT